MIYYIYIYLHCICCIWYIYICTHYIIISLYNALLFQRHVSSEDCHIRLLQKLPSFEEKKRCDRVGFACPRALTHDGVFLTVSWSCFDFLTPLDDRAQISCHFLGTWRWSWCGKKCSKSPSNITALSWGPILREIGPNLWMIWSWQKYETWYNDRYITLLDRNDLAFSAKLRSIGSACPPWFPRTGTGGLGIMRCNIPVQTACSGRVNTLDEDVRVVFTTSGLQGCKVFTINFQGFGVCEYLWKLTSSEDKIR